MHIVVAEHLWIGLQEMLIWSDGTVLFEDGIFPISLSSSLCFAVDNSVSIQSENCASTMGYICQRDKKGKSCSCCEYSGIIKLLYMIFIGDNFFCW